MIPDSASAQAARMMAEFAMRTGLGQPARDHERYLWTDAFAVCNFLELLRRTHDEKYLRYAMELIDKVHQVLGHYREARPAAKTLGTVGATGLGAAIESLALLCHQRNWTTDDPLGLGGLLFDACRLCRLP